VLALCAESGLVRVGVIAVDGTRVAANASPQATRDYEQIAREILAEADGVDAEEDERPRLRSQRMADATYSAYGCSVRQRVSDDRRAGRI
jgi:hypothetical protein